MKRLALVVVALGVALTGCTGGGDPAPTPSPEDRTTILEPAPLTTAPGELVIPSLNVRSSLVPLGKTAAGDHEVPPVTQPGQAGWYRPGPEPGQTGPAIILGHVNGGGQPGVFSKLNTMQPGQSVKVGDQEYKVYNVLQVNKEGEFPAQEVYGSTPGPELRLITCGGRFVGGDLGYEDNWIVFARKV